MLFFNVGTGRPPNHAQEAPKGSFNEIWAIYDALELAYDADCADPAFEGEVVQTLEVTSSCGAMTPAPATRRPQPTR